MLTFGLILVVLSGAAVAASFVLGRHTRSPEGFLPSHPSVLAENLRLYGIIGLILGAKITYLGLLFASFTVFTAISIFGVFLGPFAPIVTLSVMSGFEVDLKVKIRGAKADVVITREDDRPFTEWRDVRRRIAGIPHVAASTPYLEAEVMIRAGGTPVGIIVRGIDPETA